MNEHDPNHKTRVDTRLLRAIESGSLPKDLLICGPAGTGKTYSILRTLHTIAADYDNVRILICRQTRRSLTESVMVTFEQEILPADGMSHIAEGQGRKTRDAYNYPDSGSTIVLGGMDSPGRITSTAWDIAFVNESIELQEDAWETIRSRLNRPGRPSYFGWLVGDTNPGDPSHWLLKRTIEGQTKLWNTSHHANPLMHDGRDWTPAGALYRESLAGLKGTRRKRYFEGVWAAGAGQWFENFADVHTSARAAYKPWLPLHLAVDSGVHTGAVWVQFVPIADGFEVHVPADFYIFHHPAHEVAKLIIAKTVELTGRADGRVDRGVADPAGNAATGVGVTVDGEYRRAGLKLEPWPSYPGSVVDGLALIDSFVSSHPEPTLFVHPGCTHLLNAFANYKRAQKSKQYIDRPADPQHPYEDVMDAFRGAVQDKFPEGRRPVPQFRRVPARNLF